MNYSIAAAAIRHTVLAITQLLLTQSLIRTIYKAKTISHSKRRRYI